MIYLLMAIASSSLVAIVMRTSEKYVNGNHGMLAVNYVICAVMAAFYSGIGGLFPEVEGNGFTLGLGIVSKAWFGCSGFHIHCVFQRTTGTVPNLRAFHLFCCNCFE